jgi:hypothetical protein
MTRNVTARLPETVRDTPTHDVGHPPSPARTRQSPTQQGPREKGIPSLVTQVPGIARTRQLRIIGNGVVPQQASMALRLLIEAASLPAPPAPAARMPAAA